jgi:ornithine cyclodeaminase
VDHGSRCCGGVEPAEAIPALEAGLALEAAGAARNMAKTHQIWGGHHTLHAIGAVVEGANIVGTKTWAHTAGGATPLVTLWNSDTGRLEAIVEAFALGQMRTGGISGVATARMANRGADDLAIIGTGKQAMTQVVAVASVRPLKRIRVFSPTAENRQAFPRAIENFSRNRSVEPIGRGERSRMRRSSRW